MDSELKQDDLVRYFLDGWRYGHIDEVVGQNVRIRPIPGYKAHPRCVKVSLSDVVKCFES